MTLRELSFRKVAAAVALVGLSIFLLTGCSGQTIVQAEEQEGERYKINVWLDPPTLNIPQLGTITYEVIDTANRSKPVTEFEEASGALLHHALFSHDLEYFFHSYTDVVVDNKASVFVNFPKLGGYYSFALFKPAGSELHTFRQEIIAGPAEEREPNLVPDVSGTKTAGWLTAQLVKEPEIHKGRTAQMVLHFSERGQPVTALSPYLNAPGHLWLIDSHGEHFAHVAGAAEGRLVQPQGTAEVGARRTGTPEARQTRTPQATGTAEGEEPPTTSGSTTGGTGAAGSGQGGTRTGGPGTPPVESEPLPVEKPTYAPAIAGALATTTAGPAPTLGVAQQTAQAYLASTPETGSAYVFGPEVAFTHTFPEAGLYKLWFEVKHRGQVVLVSYVVEVGE